MSTPSKKRGLPTPPSSQRKHRRITRRYDPDVEYSGPSIPSRSERRSRDSSTDSELPTLAEVLEAGRQQREARNNAAVDDDVESIVVDREQDYVPTRDQSVVFDGTRLSLTHSPPKHMWKEEEKVALYIIRRWFSNNWANIAELLNAAFASVTDSFHTQSVQSMWRDALRSKSVLFAGIQAIRFLSPGDAIQSINQRLTTIADSQGIVLCPRTNDVSTQGCGPRGGSRSELAQLTAVLQSLEEMLQRNIQRPATLIGDLQAWALKREEQDDDADDEDDTTITTREEHDAPPNPLVHQSGPVQSGGQSEGELPTLSANTPSLLFRFYNDASGGLNSRHGFRPGGAMNELAILPHPSQASIDMFYRQASHHFHEKRCGSPFISTSNDILWPVLLATHSESEKNPKIAALSTDTACKEKRLFHAAAVMTQLRSRNLAGRWWYKGQREYLVWGNIEAPSIIGEASLRDIERLAQTSTDVKDFIRIDILRQDARVGKTYSRLGSRNLRLGRSVGTAIAKLLHLFGVKATADKEIIKGMIRTFLQGWRPLHSDSDDNGILWQTASAFVTVQLAGLAGPQNDQRMRGLKLKLFAAFMAAFEQWHDELRSWTVVSSKK